MTAPMPKDNEVDEKVMPVAWQWLDTSNFRKNIPSAAIREHWNPLYSAATVAELRARIDELANELRHANKGYVHELNRATAAERRLREVREIQRTHYGDGIGLHVAMILWTRDYDALTGADPT